MLRHLTHMLPTLILSHGKKVAMTRAKAFVKWDWKSLLNKCQSHSVARQDKLVQAPQTATTQSTKQMDVLTQKYARAGNFKSYTRPAKLFARPSNQRSSRTL